jgi:hypothetical protein
MPRAKTKSPMRATSRSLRTERKLKTEKPVRTPMPKVKGTTAKSMENPSPFDLLYGGRLVDDMAQRRSGSPTGRFTVGIGQCSCAHCTARHDRRQKEKLAAHALNYGMGTPKAESILGSDFSKIEERVASWLKDLQFTGRPRSDVPSGVVMGPSGTKHSRVNSETGEVSEVSLLWLETPLVERLMTLSRNRGAKIEDILTIALANIEASVRTLDLSSKLPFGKYAGQVVETVTRVDPGYIDWMVRKVESVTFTPAVINLLKEMR